MKKYILTSLITLLTYEAYASFDFGNYVPVAYQNANTYNVSIGNNIIIPVGYNISFLPETEQTDADFSYYTFDADNAITANHYFVDISSSFNYVELVPGSSGPGGLTVHNWVYSDTDENSNFIGYWDNGYSVGHVTSFLQNDTPAYICNTSPHYGRVFGNVFDANIYNIKSQITGSYSINRAYAEFINNTTSSNQYHDLFLFNSVMDEVGLDIVNNIFSTTANPFAIVHVTSNVDNMFVDFVKNRMIKTTTGPGNNFLSDFLSNYATINNLNINMIYNDSVRVGFANYGQISILQSDFIANQNVGTLFFNAGTINNISIDVNNNVAGQIFKNEGIIGTISGDFIANSGYVFKNEGTIDTVNGNFIGNTGGDKGVFENIDAVTNVNINFINNTSRATSDDSAGALYTNHTLNIKGNFINNKKQCYGFCSNNYAGAVFNDSTETLNFVSDTENYKISDNYVRIGDDILPIMDTGIYTKGNINFTNINSTHYTINDEIDGSNYNLIISGDNTGYSIFNNDIINANAVNINNGKMVFGRTPNDYTGTADTGRFNITNPTMNLNNGTFDIANGYTETVTLNNLVSAGNSNTIKIDLDINNNVSDIVISENTIQGQINLVVNALSNLDLQDNIVWFAYANNDSSSIASADTFVLSNIDNLSYDLDVVFDVIETKWGLQKDPNSTYVPDEPENPENPDNPDNPNNPDEPDNPDNPENPDEPNNPENPENPDNPNNPDEPDTPTEPEQPVQPTVSVLPVEVVQMADYTAKTVTNTVQKLTNSMQKRVGELQWLLKDTDNQSDLNNAFWTRGIHKNFDADNTSVGLSGIEFGYDRIISSTNNYKWYIGGLGYISGGDSKFKDTKLDISGYGLGAYLMVLEKSGWFADAVFRQHFINMETSDVKTDYTASSLNLEIGKEFVFGSDKLKWFMKPSLEGTYISISGTDIGSFKVQDSTSSMASLSVLAGPRWDFASGRKFQAYGKVGYTLDNSDDVDVIVNGVNTKQTVATNTTEMGIGFDYRGIDNATNIYLEASYITGTDYSEISGNLGLRYAF